MGIDMNGKGISPAAAGLALCIALTTSAGVVHADERPLIWQPTKNSATSYAARLGVRLPVEYQPKMGVDVAMDTNTGGGLVDTPVKFWTSVKMGSIERPAYEMNRDIGVDIDGNAGSAAISISSQVKAIASATFDIERDSAYSVHYDGATQEWTGLDASQQLRFSRTGTGTAFIMRASATDNFKTAGAGIGLEQKLGDHITLTGSYDRSSNADAVASINANYAWKW
jgi:hypothetical protein